MNKPTETQLPLRWLTALVLLLVGVRVALMLVLAPTFDFTQPGIDIHGSEAYDEYALNLLETGVYGRTPGVPDSMIPPLYSYALAAVYGLFGRGYVQVVLFNVLLDAISLLLLVDTARRLLPDKPLFGQSVAVWSALLAGLFFAVYPYLAFQTVTLIDTLFWITLLHAFVWLMVLLRDQETFNRRTLLIALAGGVVLGLSMLTRPLLPLLALLVALWFLFRRSLWQTVARLSIVAGVGVCIVLPWVVRNYQIFDAFVPMTTASGSNLWQGNSPWVVPLFQAGYDVQWTAPEPGVIPPDLPADEADSIRADLVADYWRENPGDIPELMWTKFLVHWSIGIAPRYNPQPGETFELTDSGDLLILRGDESIIGVTGANIAYNNTLLDRVGRPVHLVYFGSLLLLSVAGLLLSLRYWRDMSLLWFVQFSMTFMYVLFHPSTRYRAPTDPLLFVLSAFALVMAFDWWRNRQATA